MKKKALMMAAVVLTLTVAGCSKSVQCNCTTTQTLPGMNPMVTTTTMTADDGKCDKLDATQTTVTPDGQTMTQTVKCS